MDQDEVHNYSTQVSELRAAIQVAPIKPGAEDSEAPLWGPQQQQALGDIIIAAVRWLTRHGERGQRYIHEIEDTVEQALGHRRPTADLPKGAMDAAWAATYASLLEVHTGRPAPECGDDVRLWDDDAHAMEEVMIVYDAMAEELAAILASAERELVNLEARPIAEGATPKAQEPPYNGTPEEQRAWIAMRMGWATTKYVTNYVGKHKEKHGVAPSWAIYKSSKKLIYDLHEFEKWLKTPEGIQEVAPKRRGRPPRRR